MIKNVTHFSLMLLVLMGLSISPMGAWAQSSPVSPNTGAPTKALPPSLRPNGKITKEQAGAFYAQCRDNPAALQDLNPIQRGTFCGCLADGMQAFLTTDIITKMNNPQTDEGRAALGTMLEKVYFPCSLPVIDETIRGECIGRASRGTPAQAQAGQQYCGCLVRHMMTYVQQVGIAETLYTLKISGRMTEPLDALKGSSGYNKEMIRAYQTCFSGQIP